ncbi:unnamed protein product [Mucor circinelloides]
MPTISALPQELLFAILNNVPNVKQLAQCRLVCKRWEESATKAIFAKKITIKSEEQAFKLYRHLYRDTSKVPLIKHLHFELDDDDLHFLVKELLQLTFTPSIQRFTGFAKADRFFTTLFNIVDRSPSSFDQLEEMTKYTGVDMSILDQRRLKFGSIIRTFSLRVVKNNTFTNSTVIWSDHFHLFRNLTEFTLMGAPSGLNGIEQIIEGCHYLSTLSLVNMDYGGQTVAKMTTEEVISWASNNVNKEESLKTLSIKTLCRPELIEYLLFKYPNVANITIDGRFWSSSNDLVVDHANLSRVLDAVKRIRQKQLKLILPPTIIIMKNALEFFTTPDEVITFGIKPIQGQTQLVMEMN